jgi:hypothetical protein
VDLIDNSRPRAIPVLLLALILAAAVTARGPDKNVPPSSGPWAACPHGEHRIKDGWLRWDRQWVCE